jgi:hypothetical protein
VQPGAQGKQADESSIQKPQNSNGHRPPGGQQGHRRAAPPPQATKKAFCCSCFFHYSYKLSLVGIKFSIFARLGCINVQSQGDVRTIVRESLVVSAYSLLKNACTLNYYTRRSH